MKILLLEPLYWLYRCAESPSPSLLLAPGQAWCWGDEGHQTVARIAAAHLTERARQAVARLLRRTPICSARHAAPIRWPTPWRAPPSGPITWRAAKAPPPPGTTSISGCSKARRTCRALPASDCIVAKMNRCLVNLKQHRADGGVWPESKELAFLMHFAGDIHQPLHCASDADAGGNCVNVAGFEPMENLHAVWDIALVRKLMAAHDGPACWPAWNPASAADAGLAGLRQHRADRRRVLPVSPNRRCTARRAASPGDRKVHRSAAAQLAPRRRPKAVRKVRVDGLRSYGSRSLDVVRMQLYRGGVRLAAMLNAIYAE
jgi:hypothetical protein